MSFIKDTFFGGAEEKAAEAQAAAGREAIGETRATRAEARADVEPFRQFGIGELPRITESRAGLEELTTDPEAQRRFVTENPFFKSLADEAERRLFQNQAARGKVASGETAEALQKSVLLLGNDLLQQGIANRFRNINQGLNIATIGANAATRQASTTLQTGQQIAGIQTDIGNVTAAGIIGQKEARKSTITDIVTGGFKFDKIKLG